MPDARPVPGMRIPAARAHVPDLRSLLLALAWAATLAGFVVATPPRTAEAQIPRALSAPPPRLTWLPTEGFVIPSAEEYVRLEARNVPVVEVRFRWIREAEARRIWGSPEPREAGAALVGTDAAEFWTPDSLAFAARDFPLASLPARPPDARGLYCEARGPEGTTATALIQLVTLGLTAHLGEEAGLLWVTDLVSGQPVSRAEVSLWGAEPDADGVRRSGPESGEATVPLWRGVTDADGLAWIPGPRVLAPSGRPALARAARRSEVAWLPLALPTRVAAPADSGTRALLWTDREIYAPEDRLRWQLLSLDRIGNALVFRPGNAFLLALEGPLGRGPDVRSGSGGQSVITNRSSEAHGELPLPRTSGLYRVTVRSTTDRALLAERTVRIAEPGTPALGLTLEAPPGLLLGRTGLTALAAVSGTDGRPLPGLPLRWSVEATPLTDRSVPAFPRFRFSASGEDTLPGPVVEMRADERSGDDGTAQGRLAVTAPRGGTVPHLLRIRCQARVEPGGGSADIERIWYPGAHRIGVRDASEDPDARGVLAWEWIVVDERGRAVADVPVRIELLRIDLPRDTVVDTREERSELGPVRFRPSRPGPGIYALRVVLADGTTAEARPDAPSAAFADTHADRGPGTGAGHGRDDAPRSVGAEASEPVGSVPRSSTSVASSSGPAGVPAFPSSSGPASPTSPAPASFLRLEPTGGELRVSLAGSPLAGASTLFLVERGGVFAARSERVLGNTPVTLPVPPLPPPDARLHVTQVGSDPSRVEEDGGVRNRLPFYRAGSTRVPSDLPGHRVDVRLTVAPSRENDDSLDVTVVLETPEGARTGGRVTLVITEVRDDARAIGTGDDPLATIFADDPSRPGHRELRDLLALSGRPATLATGFRPDGGTAGPESASPARPAEMTGAEGSAERLVAWRPDLLVPAERGLRVRLPAGGTAYRVRAFARTADLRFGSAEQIAVRRPEIRLELAPVEVLRAGDRIAWPLRLTNRGDRARSGRIEVTLVGGTLLRAPANVALGPGETWEDVVEIETPDAGALALEARYLGGDEAVLARASRTLEVVRPFIERVTVRSGLAAPRGETEIDLEDGRILAADGIEVRLAPTYFLELVDAIDAFLADPVPGVERETARLAAAAIARRHAAWFGLEEVTLAAIAAESAARLMATGLPQGPGRALPLGESVTDRALRPFREDAQVRWAATLAADAGLPVPAAWIAQLDRAARDFQDGARTALSAPVLDLAAFQAWVDGLGAGSGPREADLTALLARETRLGTNGRLWLALALGSAARGDVSAALLPQFDAQFRALLADYEAGTIPGLSPSSAGGTTPPRPGLASPAGVRGNVDGTGPAAPASDGPAAGGRAGVAPSDAPPSDATPTFVGPAGGASLLTNAVFLELLAARAPNHEDVPALLRGLLAARDAAGRFADPGAGVFASAAIATLLARVEEPGRTRSAQLVLGASSAHDFRFDPAAPGVANARFDLAALARLRRHDPTTTQLRVGVTTDRAATLHYQIRTTERTPAVRAAATAGGTLRVLRRYRDALGREVLPAARESGVGRVALDGAIATVEIEVELDAPVSGLYLRETLPPGAVFRGWIDGSDRIGMDGDTIFPLDARRRAGPTTPPPTSPVRQASALHAGQLDLSVGALPAGRHVWRYGLELGTEGTFGVPGTRVWLLDRVGTEARGPAHTVTVLR